MSKLLASVRSLDESHIVLNASADILDLKEPQQGALGALDVEIVREITNRYKKKCPISATAGDLPPDPQILIRKIEELADANVDYIKIGFFDETYFETCAGALRPLAQHHALIGVLFADQLYDFEGPTRLLKNADFTGVMIDTIDKSRGSILQFTDMQTLDRFVTVAHDLSMLCGIAGSLTLSDIESFASLGADYLGFRTALCENSRRENPICAKATAEVAKKINDTSKLVS